MAVICVIALVGDVLLAVGGLAGLFALISLATPAADTAGFAMSAALGLFLGGAVRMTTRGRAREGGVREALAFLLLIWLLAPAVAAAPLWASAPEAGLARAYVDTVAAATTTGYPPIANGAAPGIVVYWWALLQWLGGGFSIVGALVVLSALNLGGPGVHRSVFFTLQPDKLLGRFAPIARAIAPLYGGVTIVVWALAWIGGARAGDAISLATAAVATGGLWFAGGETSAAHIPTPALLGACVGLAFGALSFVLHWDAVRGRADRGYLLHEENLAVLPLVGLAMLAVVLAGASLENVSWVRSAVESVALAATAGWDAGGVGVTAMAAPLALAVVLIGGAPVSTAGGLKILRTLLLVRHVGSELRRLAHPLSVSDVRYRGQILPQRNVMGLLLHVLGFTLVVAALTLFLSSGADRFEHALAAAVAAVANVGPIATVAGGGPLETMVSDRLSLFVLCAGMIIGRVEVLAAFAALNPSFWRG